MVRPTSMNKVEILVAPLVMESLGRFGPESDATLRQLARAAAAIEHERHQEEQRHSQTPKLLPPRERRTASKRAVVPRLQGEPRARSRAIGEAEERGKAHRPYFMTSLRLYVAALLQSTDIRLLLPSCSMLFARTSGKRSVATGDHFAGNANFARPCRCTS